MLWSPIKNIDCLNDLIDIAIKFWSDRGKSAGNIAGAGIIFIKCSPGDPTQAWQLVNIPNSAYLICANSNFCMSVNYGNLCSYAYLVKKNPSDKAQQWKTLSNGSVTNVFLASNGFNLCAQSVLGLYSGVVVSYINMIDCYSVPSQIFKTSPRLPVGWKFLASENFKR